MKKPTKKPVKKISVKKECTPSCKQLYDGVIQSIATILEKRHEQGHTPEAINKFLNVMLAKVHAEVIVKYEIMESVSP